MSATVIFSAIFAAISAGNRGLTSRSRNVAKHRCSHQILGSPHWGAASVKQRQTLSSASKWLLSQRISKVRAKNSKCGIRQLQKRAKAPCKTRIQVLRNNGFLLPRGEGLTSTFLIRFLHSGWSSSLGFRALLTQGSCFFFTFA